MHLAKTVKLLLAGTAFAAASAAGASAPERYAELDDQIERLRDLSLEDLSKVVVTSVSKREESLNKAAAAIYVITRDDIRRSGATSLPQALRQAPNLQVQQVDARQYSISARGFNGFENANKLLVLIDGRSVYTPLASSVYWDLNEPLLDDLERIEVVSGPGGTLYGPNAVNGVINVISRSAIDTQGLLARGVAGTRDQSASLRYGAPIGDAGAIRIHGTAFRRDDSILAPGDSAQDSWKGLQLGFRSDFDVAAGRFTLQGDWFDNTIDVGQNNGNKGHNLLGRWQGAVGDRLTVQVQAYHDKFERRFFGVFDSLETWDGQLQLDWVGDRHSIVFGGGFRTTKDAFINNLNPFRLQPERRTLTVGNVFFQDQVALSDSLSVTAGVKLEKTSFTGVEVLPNIRLAWTPSEKVLLWSAVSQAVRTPSRIDRQLAFLPILAPGSSFDTEKLLAFEAGYRGRPAPNMSLSVSFFLNRYDDLRTTESVGATFLPLQLQNGMKGTSYGVEIWGSVQPAPRWRLSAGLFAIGKDFKFKRGVVDITGGEAHGQDPTYEARLRSQLDLTDRLQIDVMLRLVDDLPGTSGGNLPIPAYAEADVRVAWQVNEHIELELAGSNLLHDHRAESFFRPPVHEIRRRIHVGTRLSF